jgi:hypothetical protein
MNYSHIVAALPVATPEQTSRFADHVADNHSWYKHLPFFPPGASFVFFPNPHAGLEVKADGDGFAICDIERGDYFSHHSRLSTADYRSQFGHWDYWVIDNARVSGRVDGPWIYGLPGGRREVLPETLKRNWSCRLTAFLKPMPRMFTLCVDNFARERQAFTNYAQQYSDDVRVVRFQTMAEEFRQVDESLWDNNAMFEFAEAEAQIQKILLLGTLQRVQAAWSELSGIRRRC